MVGPFSKDPQKIKKQDACRFECSFPLALLIARDFRTAMVNLVSMIVAVAWILRMNTCQAIQDSKLIFVPLCNKTQVKKYKKV